MQQAREYCERVDRPNLMIKIPGTAEGLPAIEEMIYEGRNINVTLLFAVSEYERVMEAYIRGLERRHVQGEDVDVRSVASFFVSRVDTEVDRRLEDLGRTDLFGRAGLANARAAYRRFTAVFHGERFAALRAAGRAGAAPAVGLDAGQEPQLPRRHVRRGPRRARDRQHHADGDTARRRRPRARRSASHGPHRPGARPAGAGRGGDRPRRRHGPAADRGRREVRRPLRGADDRHRATARGDRTMARPPAIQGSIPDQLEPRIALRVQRAVEEDVARRIWRKDASLWGDPDQPSWPIAWAG
jgi:hypothetical protein